MNNQNHNEIEYLFEFLLVIALNIRKTNQAVRFCFLYSHFSKSEKLGSVFNGNKWDIIYFKTTIQKVVF